MTKYDMCLTMAKAFNLPTSHIIADKNQSSGTKRPYDAHMDQTRIQALGINPTDAIRCRYPVVYHKEHIHRRSSPAKDPVECTCIVGSF